MLNVLRSIADVIINIAEFLISFFVSFFELIKNIPQYLSFITNNLSSLPNIVIPFATASISLYIVFLILGRNN